MRKIAFLGAKGGIGKTTSTILTAMALAAQGEVVAVIDTDPQASARSWSDYAAQGGFPLPFETVAAGTDFSRRKSPTTWQLLDTPPGNQAIINEAIRWADLVILPTRPGALDLLQLGPLLTLLGKEHTPAAVLLVQTRARVKETTDTAAAITHADAFLMQTQIPLKAGTSRLALTHPTRAQLKETGYWDVATELQEAFA